jgi:hypothetical protein
MVLWGALELAYVVWAWHGLAMRDVAGATRLDRLVWLNLGLDVGMIGAGAVTAIIGWVDGRRLALLGSGIGVALQGAALFLINAQLAASISR